MTVITKRRTNLMGISYAVMGIALGWSVPVLMVIFFDDDLAQWTIDFNRGLISSNLPCSPVPTMLACS